ncbi:AraC family transcriptional regulator [Rhizobium sp. S-51]|uniref:AraC family transcriptional regulator n=2 Tax=Rhizobium terricola TaxID=2728849 RepID=A0A7Y0AYH6_9HYPH|nr:AraC family transcriptional regulator [Rhizobium terricola]
MNDEIYFPVARAEAAFFAYRLLVAGSRRARPADPAITTLFHEQCLILTLSGRGIVDAGRTRSVVTAGDVAWIDTARPYAHHCHGESDIWHYLWISIDGTGIADLHGWLGFREAPVIACGEAAELADQMREILRLARMPDRHVLGTLNVAVAHVLSVIARSRLTLAEKTLSRGDQAMEALVAQVRRDIAADWSVPRMALSAGVSCSQLHRRFLKTFDQSPARWLRQERINLARRYLLSGFEKISTIASRCGYDDPFHFSRDFRVLTGLSPTDYRKSQADGASADRGSSAET